LSGSEARPVLGLTTYLQRAQTGVWDVDASFLPAIYIDGVNRGGATAMLLPPQPGGTEAADRILDGIDGLIITGGRDVNPESYGSQRHPTTDEPMGERDSWEFALLNAALRRGMPVLGICRGAQVLNVARGGTLVQDIPSELPDAIPHEVRDTPFTIAHDVWVSEGTLLHTLLRERIDGDACPVNSRHHQAVQKVGSGLVVSATAPDGVIEAVEDPSKRFCVGVQWHPENFYRTGEFRALFEAFIAAAQERV
jgi:putative glutamine amidotransferase